MLIEALDAEIARRVDAFEALIQLLLLALMLIVITSTNMPVTGSAGYSRFRRGLGM